MDLTVYIAKRIYTMNPSMPVATAVVVADGDSVEVTIRESVQPWLDVIQTVSMTRSGTRPSCPGSSIHTSIHRWRPC